MIFMRHGEAKISPLTINHCFTAINGYVFGNLPDLSMCMGNKIQWHLFGIGNEVDIHSAFFHGQILKNRQHRTDTISLFPATFVSVEMEADNPGQWLLACQVNDHLEGMIRKHFSSEFVFFRIMELLNIFIQATNALLLI